MNLKTLLALTLGVVMVTRIEAAPTQAPLQGRINTELLASVFHKRDQEVLNVVKGMKIDDEGLFTDVTASILPSKNIAFEDFDFDLHLKNDYLGAESSKLIYEGSGKYNGADFTFSGPVNMVKLRYALGKKYNPEIKYWANVFEPAEYLFDVSDAGLKVEGADLTAGDKKQLLTMLTNQVESVKDKCLAGKDEIVPNFPMDVAVPFVGMFYFVQFAEKVEFEEKFMSMGLSLKHFEMLSDK
jgi:hypothetical protein